MFAPLQCGPAVTTRGDHILPTLQAQPAAADVTRTSAPNDATNPGSPALPIAPGQPRDRSRYQILGEHGRGGIGCVSRAHDRELGRDVAIKELIARDSVHEVRFLREALITARLEHPGIVPVHEAGRWPDGTPFYAMKLVAGRPLRDLLAERTTVEQRIALLHHVIAVADAMAYAHGRNIIHRDLKPANVIVGDFGETVVIDWGLAKDLTSEDGPSSSPSGMVRRDSDLTVTGSVLGTPAYMAPEQERGESVDQRADVFAIGAMLWELCTVHKLPPRDALRRRRILRSAGIDRDLVTIIEKALAHNREDRYANAGALAADLKAFKSGARITARDYSLLAMLAHWTRKHRALAISAAVLAVVGLAGIALYVRNIAIERDRADSALGEARTANTAAATANGNLVLKNAELLLASDPSAAWDALADYRGPDQPLAQLLRAKAKGLGIAKLRVSAHKDTVARLHPLANGTLLSISEDGTIAVTTADGKSEIVARDATRDDASDFTTARGLLAYACQPKAICILDPIRRSRTMIPAAEPEAPAGIAFSPDGTRLAARYGDRIVVWQVDSEPSRSVLRTSVPAAQRPMFVTEGALAVIAAHRVHLIDLRSKATHVLEVSASVAASSGEGILIGTGEGGILAVTASTWPKPSWTYPVCSGRVNGITALRSRHAFAYACQTGDVGIRDLQSPGQLIAHYHQGGAVLSITGSDDDRYVVSGGTGGAMRIYDLASEILTHYNGQITRLGSVSGPTPAFPYFASGDDDGYLRIWSTPQTAARTAIRARAPLYDLNIFDDGTVVGLGVEGELYWARGNATGHLLAHAAGGFGVRKSPDPTRFATLSYDGSMAVWDTTRFSLIRRISAGTVTDMRFIDQTSLITTGEDGRLLLWASDREQPRLRARFSQPPTAMQLLRGGRELVVAERGGALSAMTLDSQAPPRQIRANHGDGVYLLASSSDDRRLVIGTTTGAVVLYDTTTWTETAVMTAEGGIHSMAISPDGALLSVVSDAGFVHLMPVPATRGDVHGDFAHWRRLAIPARSTRFSPDGSILAITTSDGGVCFYTVHDRSWHYVAFPGIDIFGGRFSADGRRYVTSDDNAHIVSFDIASLLN